MAGSRSAVRMGVEGSWEHVLAFNPKGLENVNYKV
jgi:hypothetical protein